MKSLSDVVGASGLAWYAEVALVLFLVAFIVMAARAFFARREDIEHAAHIPFDEPDTSSSRAPRSAD